MEQRELLRMILERLDEITGTADPAASGELEPAVFQRLDQVAKIVSSIQRYLPKRVIDKILLNPEGVKVEGERRPVTILFGDLSGFTAMSETMDPEQVVTVINGYFDKMVEIAERYGGHIDKFMGDALMVLFGAPVTHEDDALRACLAALEMQAAMQEYNRECRIGINLAMSIGLNSGEVVALNVGSKNRMEYTVIGDNVNLASRLEGVAQANESVMGENTYRQIKGKIKVKKLPPVKVKGKTKPQNVYLLLGRLDTAETAAGLRAGSIAMVGRLAEMEQIRRSVEQAKSGAGQVAAITGEPGLGKSRLAKELELLARDEGFAFLKGKCYSYSQSAAYLPFLRQLQRLLDVRDTDAPGKKRDRLRDRLQGLDLTEFEPYLGSLLGIAYPEIGDLDPEKRKRKTFEGFASLFQKEATRQPLALAYEDLQWADSISLQLLEHLVGTIADLPILVCCDYRPEIALPFIARPNCAAIVLQRLDEREVLQMVSSLASVGDVSDPVLLKVVQRTEGNPLFIEEITRHLLSRRLVKRDGNSLVPAKRFGTMALPGTVASVVLGRIDKLSEDLRRTLQYAAVVGKEFDREMLGHITKTGAEQLQHQLDGLEHFEGLLYSKEVEGKRFYQFHSTATQEAAYSTLLKQRRRELHGGVAQAIERDCRGDLEPHLEDLAHHYFHSAFEDKAIHYLHKAGDKARGLYANAEAIGFYDKGIGVLKKGKDRRECMIELAELLGAQGAVLRLIGQREKALKNFNAAWKISSIYEDRKNQRKYMIEAGIVIDMAGNLDKAIALWRKVLNDSIKSGDITAQANAMNLEGAFYIRREFPEKAMCCFEKALTLYEGMKDKKQLTQVLLNIGRTFEMLGQMPQAIDSYRSAIRNAIEINYREGLALNYNNLGNAYLVSGDFTSATNSFNTALEIAQVIGDKRTVTLASTSVGIISAISGNYLRAMEFFNKAFYAAEEAHDIGQMMSLLINIGCIHQLWGDCVTAVQRHQQALGLARQIGDAANEAEARRNLGIEHQLLGQYAEANDEFVQGLSLAKKVGDPRLVSYIQSNLGAYFHAVGNDRDADEVLSQALDGARQVGDPEVILSAVRGLIEAQLANERFKEAEEQITRALRIAGDTNNKREQAYAMMNAAALACAQGNVDQMTGPLVEGTELGREIGDKILLTRLYLLSARKATRTGAYDEAVHYLDDALELGQKTGSPELLWQVAYWQGELSKAQGLTEQAREHYAKARDLIEGMRPQVPEGMWKGFINNTERKLVNAALG